MTTSCYKIDLLGTGIIPSVMEPSPCQKGGGMMCTQTHLELNEVYSHMSRVTKWHKIGVGHKHQ